MLIIFLPSFFVSISGAHPESTILDMLAMIAYGSFLVRCVLAVVSANNRRAIHDLTTSTRVARAPHRKVELKRTGAMT
ncbi:hypothetical protein [Nocardia neocaledoniensis]|uniref:hypothetical protein n=1 Tax=Nocardia neocaledoniensis TaxID=236511 RepID=UPI002456BF5E|nr:hypothetical protein [Nocardia neocaledoniensis]